MPDLMKRLEKLNEENKYKVEKYVEKLLTLQRLEDRLTGKINMAEYDVKKIDPAFVEETKAKGVRCSFCGKNQYHVERIIAGPNVYICNECVELCDEVLQDVAEEEKEKK